MAIKRIDTYIVLVVFENLLMYPEIKLRFSELFQEPSENNGCWGAKYEEKYTEEDSMWFLENKSLIT